MKLHSRIVRLTDPATLRRISIIPAEIEYPADSKIPGICDAAVIARIGIIPLVVENEPDCVVTPISYAPAYETHGSSLRAIVVGPRGADPFVVSAEVARESCGKPISTTMTEIVIFIQVIACAVE